MTIMNQNSGLLVVQITDTHLFADRDRELKGTATAQSLQAVLERVKQLQPQPDMLLLTGDLSQDETPESYQHLLAAVTPLSIPSYWLPGNHDDVPLMQQILKEEPLFAHKSFPQGDWQFLLLDSTIPGCVEGELSPQSLAWLEYELQASDYPTLIALHHPPCSINSPGFDAVGLQNPDALLAIIDRHPQVQLVVFGHIHQEFSLERRGVHYFGTPSTCIQFLPQSSEFALDPSPPGFRVFKLNTDGTWETRVERVDDVL